MRLYIPPDLSHAVPVAEHKTLQIVNETKGVILAKRAIVARTAWKRVVGLLGHSKLEEGEGLLITPCNSIHSMWMRFRFDALFLDKDNRVVHVIHGMKPWRISKIVGKAKSVLELPSGTVAASGTVVGDSLIFS